MPFTVRIQNLGKLTEETIHVGQLTVLAGVNNTGKSFFSKAMYSVFDAMNAHPVKTAVNRRLVPLRSSLTRLSRSVKDASEQVPPPLHLDSMTESILHLAMVAAECSLNGDSEGDPNLDAPYSGLEKAADELNAAFALLGPEVNAWMRAANSGSPFFPDSQFVERMRRRVESLHNLAGMSRHDLVVDGLSWKVSDEFSENFQVETLGQLKGQKDVPPTVTIDGVGAFAVDLDSDRIVPNDVTHVGLLELQRFSRVVYLESPVLWKLKSALFDVLGRGRTGRFATGEVLSVPGYFYDLAIALGKKYRGKSIAQEEIRHVSDQIVRGKVALSETGELLFHEAGRGPFPMPLVATGVANLGVLAMLVEQKVVDQNTFLFIDEPEAHLHPKWQVEMANLLFALARDGAHVVIATHSVDIMKWLEVHVAKHPDARKLIELNPFTEGGVLNGDRDFDEKLSIIQGELTGPFHNLYMRGL